MRPVRPSALTVLAVALVLSWIAGSALRAQTPPAAPDPAGGTPASCTRPPCAEAPDPAAPAGEPAPPADEPAPPADDAAAPPDPAPIATDEPASVRLRNLETRVQALKEKSWRTKARVDLLKEAVLGGGIGARARIVHENRMGSEFRLVKLVYALDGTQIYARSDESGKLDGQRKVEILSGPVEPGNHTVSLLMIYHGSGYGLFSYMKGYKVTVRSSHTFTAAEGKLTEITSFGYEKGGPTTPFAKRPGVNFKVNVTSGTPAKGR